MLSAFFKNNPDDKIWWITDYEDRGNFMFSFDKEKIFSMFRDYPHELTPEQKELFDKENPYWADFFSHRPYPKKEE